MKNKIVLILILVLFLAAAGIYVFVIRPKQQALQADSTGGISDTPTVTSTANPTPTAEIMGELTIINMDKYDSSKPVNGSTINIRNKVKTDQDIIATIETDGKLVKQLPLGDYEITEIIPAEGYVKNDIVTSFTLSETSDGKTPTALINIESFTNEDMLKEQNKEPVEASNDLLPVEKTDDPGLNILPTVSQKPSASTTEQNTQTEQTSKPINANKPTNPKTSDEFSIMIATLMGTFSVAFVGYLFILKKRFYN